MSLNESRGYRRSHLTKEQKREAEAAILGLSLNDMTPQQLSPDEIERMRQIVAQHDNQRPQGIREFDLNNPPKQPYTHQEYPKVVYHHENRTHKKVHSKVEERTALNDGWENE